ncbi:hypothetical protein M2103_002467 [Ereboglobus sp. PH5-5]|uniref:FAD-dependent oxidoreductase n=1 Tax=Ereboglobus sp. PH5-5 TaxID=2940529 RepID=UPI002407596B|nr:FAD-dependent oxidoreductase [Ereboglobus sp. PH5-5]MDF9834225.1 hypothetical protein [Ereboglobus sp. PH5-5]
MTNFEKKYDVIVAGAGVAGVSAALEIARSGRSVALLEKTVMCGGLATAGFVYIYLPLCDGYGTQVSFGFAEELMHASARYGPGAPPPDWKNSAPGKTTKRLMLDFSPAAFTLAMDEMMSREPAIDRWYDTLVCASIVEDGRIKGVEVENKSGRGRVLADIVIDATGDGDVAARAGCAFHEEGNKLTIWALQTSLAVARQAAAKGDASGFLDFQMIGLEGENVDPAAKKKNYPWLGTDGKSVSRFTIETRAALLNHYAKLQSANNADTSRENLYPIALPTMAQFRTTRAIAGRATLDSGMAWKHFDDSIGLVADWRRRGSVWEIPYGAMVPLTVDGLLVAGRCISSHNDAWEVTRVIPPAAQTGQAAGIAAVLSLRKNIPPAQLAAADIQAELRRKKLPYHFDEVGLSAPESS